MAGYINESNPWDFGGALQRGLEGGRVRRAKTEAKGYLDQNDYEGAAAAILPYDPEQAAGYLSFGKRKADQEYSSGLAPYLVKSDFEGAKRFAVSKNRSADDLMKLEEWSASAKDQDKKALAEKIDMGASALYAASQLAEAGDVAGWESALGELAGQGYDVKSLQGRPYNRAQLQAELVKSKKGLEILGVVNAERKSALDERRVGAMEMTAQAALARASRPEKVDEGIGGSGLSKEQVSTANALRDDYKAATKDFQVIADTVRRSQAYYERANKGQPSGQGDVGLVYALAKIYDPNSVVREGEFATMAKQGGYGEQMKSWVSQALGGGFSPAIRNQIMTEIRSAYGAAKRPYDSTLQQYRANAEQLAIPPEMVVTDYGAGVALDDGPRFPTPKPEAVAALRNRPALAAEFDAKYGPGASSQYLTGRR